MSGSRLKDKDGCKIAVASIISIEAFNINYCSKTFEAINSNLDANLNCFQPLNKEHKEEDEKLERKKHIEFTINGIKSKTSLFPISFSQHYSFDTAPHPSAVYFTFNLTVSIVHGRQGLNEMERIE